MTRPSSERRPDEVLEGLSKLQCDVLRIGPDIHKFHREVIEARTPAYKPPEGSTCHFASLPAELRIMVLGNLSVKQVLGVKLVSKTFNELVQANNRMIAHLISKRERQRINARIQKLCFFQVDTKDSTGLPIAYLNAVKDFVKLRGIQLFNPDSSTDGTNGELSKIYKVFIRYWLQRCKDHHAPHPWRSPRTSSMAMLLYNLIEYYLHYSERVVLEDADLETLRAVGEGGWNPRLFGVDTDEQVSKIWEAFSDWDIFGYDVEIFESDEEVKAYHNRANIKRIIPACESIETLRDSTVMATRERFLEVFSEIMGIRGIPANAPYAYTMSTKAWDAPVGWTEDEMDEEWKYLMRGSLAKAALLEDIFIS